MGCKSVFIHLLSCLCFSSQKKIVQESFSQGMLLAVQDFQAISFLGYAKHKQNTKLLGKEKDEIRKCYLRKTLIFPDLVKPVDYKEVDITSAVSNRVSSYLSVCRKWWANFILVCRLFCPIFMLPSFLLGCHLGITSLLSVCLSICQSSCLSVYHTFCFSQVQQMTCEFCHNLVENYLVFSRFPASVFRKVMTSQMIQIQTTVQGIGFKKSTCASYNTGAKIIGIIGVMKLNILEEHASQVMGLQTLRRQRSFL